MPIVRAAEVSEDVLCLCGRNAMLADVALIVGIPLEHSVRRY
jgi:hypothetical protein